MDDKLKTAIIIIGLLITVSGIIYKFGKQGKQLDMNTSSIRTIKGKLGDTEKYVSSVDKVSTGNKDNLSSLRTWTSSNILDLEHVLKDQKDRLTRTNTRQEHNKEYLINYTDKQCKPS